MATMLSRRSVICGASATLALSGCSAVPRGAPTRREVVAEADAPDAGFALEIVTRARLPLYAQWGGAESSHRTGWPAGGGIPQDQRLAPGDRLSLRIWDAGETSLITSAGAQFADVSDVTITAAGFVSLPYIEDVHVAGLTSDAARRRLQEQLGSIVPSAQVQIEVVQGRRNSVDMLGGVETPGRYPLSERNLPLSSLIAAAGGVQAGLPNPQVQITRGGHTYWRSLEHVLAAPAHDPVMQGGDRVLIRSDQRSFQALGAATREEIITFDAEKVSALRAVSLMGGMADTRADPRGILVLRRYPQTATVRPSGPPDTRVVFSFDLTTADGLFSADDFALHHDDVVVATQAPSTTAQRVLVVLGSALSFGRAASSL